MQEFINNVKYEHIHALIQQRRFQEATALLEIMIQFQLNIRAGMNCG